MPKASIKEIEHGTLISFRSKNPNDTTVWQGVLESIGTFRSIRPYTNPAAYNEAVRQSDASVPSDVSLLTYFLITIDNNASEPSVVVFADEWITSGSLNEVSVGNRITVVVDDPNNNPQQILSLLASAGYASRIVPNT